MGTKPKHKQNTVTTRQDKTKQDYLNITVEHYNRHNETLTQVK